MDEFFFFISIGVHQESIPSITGEKVKAAMLEGVETALGLPKNSLKSPFYSRLQLWYAIVISLVNVL